MKVLSAFVFALLLLGCCIQMHAKGDSDELLRRSGGESYPAPYDPTVDWDRESPAISTGYYVVDSEDPAGEPWTPRPSELLVRLSDEPGTWRRIASGPNQFPPEYWENNRDGHTYFRNPGDMEDSTDNAFAGPIYIGFPFYFNGVRYDSLYISTNGLLALSNRRYFYDPETGERVIPEGQAVA